MRELRDLLLIFVVGVLLMAIVWVVNDHREPAAPTERGGSCFNHEVIHEYQDPSLPECP